MDSVFIDFICILSDMLQSYAGCAASSSDPRPAVQLVRERAVQLAGNLANYLAAVHEVDGRLV